MSLLDQPDVNFPDALRHNARFYRDLWAVVHGKERLTWQELDRRTNQVANALVANGLERGDRVILLMESSIPAFELLWGTIKAGGVAAPLNVMMAKDAVSVMIDNAEPAFVVVDDSTIDLVDVMRDRLKVRPGGFFTVDRPREGWGDARALVDTAAEDDLEVDIALDDSMSIIYSSGTTGAPKGIEHTHRARLVYPFGFGPMIKVDRYTVTLCATPLYTNGTWITMLPTLFMGGTVVLGGKFSARAFLEAVQRERVTHAFLVPTQLITILAEPDVDAYDTTSMQVLLAGGAPLTSQTFAEVTAAFPDAGLYECYGITEGWMTVALPRDWEAGKRGSVGKPIYGGDVRAIDAEGKELPRGEVGELAGWSAALMKGYFRDTERTAEMVWLGPRGRTYLRSGDVGRIDDDGFVFVSGRVKDMIISGGINVFASDIEEVFMGHPGVKEVACVGIPHEKWGETPLLLAILHDGATVTADELKAWGNERLGKFQRVHAVELRTEFPRAAHDKVLKRVLRDPYWEGRERSI